MLPWQGCLADGKPLMIDMHILDHDYGVILGWHDITCVHSRYLLQRNRVLFTCSPGLPAFDCDTVHRCKVYLRHRIPGKDGFRSNPANGFDQGDNLAYRSAGEPGAKK
jgi:hypothetical protein